MAQSALHLPPSRRTATPLRQLARARRPVLGYVGSLGSGGRLSDADIAAGIAQNIQTLGAPRCLFLRGIQTLPGLSYADASKRNEYAQRVWPFDTPASQLAQARDESACGLVTEVGWRFAGVQDDVLYRPYAERIAHGGTQYAVSRELFLAQKAGCWVSATPWREDSPLPQPADAMIIGCSSCGPSWGRGGGFYGEHEFTVCLWGADGLMYSIDGGQPGIAYRTRALVSVWTGSAGGVRTGELWCGVVDKNGQCAIGADGRPASGRRVVGYSNVAGLPFGASGNDCGPGAAQTPGGAGSADDDASSGSDLLDAGVYALGLGVLADALLGLTGFLGPGLLRR